MAGSIDTILSDVTALLDGWPSWERETWPQQAAEARAFHATGDARHAPMLRSIAQARGLTVAELAGRVEANAHAYSYAMGQIIGRRHKIIKDTKTT